MRILWIEDNDKITPEQQRNWFGEFNQTEHIIRVSDFSEAYQTIKEEPRRYDLAILDINLEYSTQVNSADFTKEIVFPKDKPFLEEAGFHLYLQLILSGFPQDRIIFLTSNIGSENKRQQYVDHFLKYLEEDETLENLEEHEARIKAAIHYGEYETFKNLLHTRQFKELIQWLEYWATQETVEIIAGETTKETFTEFKNSFYNARLLEPQAIDKKRDCSVHLQNWLNTHCCRTKENQAIFDYLILRRAMLDIIDEIYKETSTILQSPFDEELDKNSFLDGLKWQLHDFNLPENPHETIYFALCDYLTKPFEHKINKDFKSLRILRNWLSHGLIKGSKNSILTAQITGIVFLLAFKKMFNVEKYGFKNEMKRIFPKGEIDVVAIKEIANRLRKIIEIEKRGCKGVYSGTICQKKNEKWQDENFVMLFYASFFCSNSYQPDSNYFSKITCQEISK